MGETEDPVLSLLQDSVRFFVAPVLRSGVGSCQERVTITNIYSGSKPSGNVHKEPNGDRFTCHVLYCGSSLKWDVLFDATQPGSCPDVIVGGDDGNAFLPSLADIPTLCKWNAKDSSSLLRVLNELYDAYREHCRDELSRMSQGLAAQTDMLSDLKLVPKFDVLPIHLGADLQSNKERLVFAQFAIPLTVDLSLLPAYLLPVNPGPARADLHLTFYTPEAHPYVAVRLDFSLRLQRALQETSQVTLPAWGSEGDGCLHDYVPNVRHLLLDKVEQVCESYARRRDYILAFCNVYGRDPCFHVVPAAVANEYGVDVGRRLPGPLQCVFSRRPCSNMALSMPFALHLLGGGLLEFDAESFKKISFIVTSPVSPSSHALHFIIYIDLAPDFPSACPKFTIQSVYHKTAHGKPAKRIFDSGYPYSPRWAGDEMADRSRVFLMEKSLMFAQDLMANPAKKDLGMSIIW